MGDLFKTTKILPLTSEPAFHLFCTNSLQHLACTPERTQDITSLLRFNSSILWASLRIGKLSAFFQLGTTSLKPVYMPRSCGKQPLETAFCHLETKTSNITRRWGGYNFLNEKKGKNSSATCWINKIRTEMCRENSLLRQEKKKEKDCLGIFCCLQSYNLPRKIWVCTDWYCTYAAADFSHSLQQSPNCILPFSRGQSWAQWPMDATEQPVPGAAEVSSVKLRSCQCGKVLLLWIVQLNQYCYSRIISSRGMLAPD